MGTTTRLVELADAEPLARLYVANRTFLEPWEPVRPAEFFTPDGQRAAVVQLLKWHRDGVSAPHVILDDGEIVGRVTLSAIVSGNFKSCVLGYWVSQAHNGRGHASAAVAAMCAIAFDDLRLHRVEAGTLISNARSQRVLRRNGFSEFGLAPKYLRIAGVWQDHVLFQKLNEAV